jgi:hypothetical protein
MHTNIYIYIYIYIYMFVCVCVCDSLIIGKFWSLLLVLKDRMLYEVCCSSSNKGYVRQLRSDWPVEL